ncbi:MAG: sodium:calcium antiporter [Xanthomonadales bacterium]|nr:sodium:calcium antiporter [Xanthomonadales bacterium]
MWRHGCTRSARLAIGPLLAFPAPQSGCILACFFNFSSSPSAWPFLAVGADLFVKGASSVAERFGISPLVIGLVIVGFGTSTPELAVNIGAAINGNTDIAIGNVVGSNIANVGVILGLAALVAPLACAAAGGARRTADHDCHQLPDLGPCELWPTGPLGGLHSGRRVRRFHALPVEVLEE